MTTIADVLSGREQWVVLEANCSEVLPILPPRSMGHVITDPPFSQHVHSLQRRVMTGPHRQFARQRGSRAKDLQYHGNPIVADLGFSHLTPELRRLCGVHFARVARRWIVVKSDEKGYPGWEADLQRARARYVRLGTWWKIGAQPNLSGRMPAPDREALNIAHAQGAPMRWNGGGKHASWYAANVSPLGRDILPEFMTYRLPIATDRNGSGERVHTTQTPVALWEAIVEDFTDPSELVLDPFCGSGSLGIACVRLGRRYLGMDNGKDGNGKPWAEWAREGIRAEEQGLSRGAARAGQLGLFASPG
jgi:site-specific DNA-methyltransferase (adenine-specific)